MRVVHWIPNFSLGGIPKAGCVLAAAMSRSGHSAWVISPEGGPRYQGAISPTLSHVILKEPAIREVVERIVELGPDVIHIHSDSYREDLVNSLFGRMSADFRQGRRVIVSTPVFGRPPTDSALLKRTRTCCVGVYTFYRLCRWLSLSPESAVVSGIGFVPLTPFERPLIDVSATDSPAAVNERREGLGISSRAFVVGRIGRDDPGKWHPQSEQLVEQVLTRFDGAVWLSVGFPAERGEGRLRQKWGRRFCNFPETADYGLLTRVLSSMDVQMFMSVSGECFASSICEAASLGVPTIALANPLRDNGQSEQVIDGVTGALVASIDDAVRALEGLVGQSSRSTALKNSTRKYATERWSDEKVTADALRLYEHWMIQAAGISKPSVDWPECLREMSRQAQNFSVGYRSRMSTIIGGNAIKRLKWRILLAMAESWTLFRLGRFLKRIRHPIRAGRG